MESKIQKFKKNNSTINGEKLILFITGMLMLFSISVLTVSCKPNANDALVVEDKQASLDSMKVVIEKQNMELAKQKSIDSMQTIVEQQKHMRQGVVSHNTNTTTTVVEKRKGWSRAAKGAVIGAGVGAVAGSVINKNNHTEGAIIGGLAGAGLGAGTGAIIDSEKAKKGK